MQGEQYGEVAKALREGDLDKAPVTPAERLLLEFVGTQTRHAYKITDAQVQGLRDAGWTEPQIAEAAYIGALFNMLTGGRHAHLPYTGAGPSMRDLAANVFDFMFADIGTVMPLTEGDTPVRMLAATVAKAPAIAPKLPTIAEVGLPELQSDTWTAFTAPPGTPLDIREKLAAAIREIMFTPEVMAQLAKLGVEPWGYGPKEMADLVAKETARWTDVVRKANAKL